jgi:hypothetical protein
VVAVAVGAADGAADGVPVADGVGQSVGEGSVVRGGGSSAWATIIGWSVDRRTLALRLAV